MCPLYCGWPLYCHQKAHLQNPSSPFKQELGEAKIHTGFQLHSRVFPSPGLNPALPSCSSFKWRTPTVRLGRFSKNWIGNNLQSNAGASTVVSVLFSPHLPPSVRGPGLAATEQGAGADGGGCPPCLKTSDACPLPGQHRAGPGSYQSQAGPSSAPACQLLRLAVPRPRTSIRMTCRPVCRVGRHGHVRTQAAKKAICSLLVEERSRV